MARGLGRTEGVSDAALFGASAQHITHDLGGSLTFVPAGTAGADAREVLESPAWARLWSGAASPGLALVLVPVGHPGTDRILETAEAVIVAGPHDAQPSLAESIARKTVAVVGPPVEARGAGAEVSGAIPNTDVPQPGDPLPASETVGHEPAAVPQEEPTAATPPWRSVEAEGHEPTLGSVDLSAPVDIDLDDIDELDVMEEAASAAVTEQWLEPAPIAKKPSGPDAWSELGSALSLRESFQDASEDEAESPAEHVAASGEPGPKDPASEIPGLVSPDVDRLVKSESTGLGPLNGEVEPAPETAVEDTQPSVEALQALAKRSQRTAPEPRELPIRRVALLVVLMALLFAIWMGWIPVPFTS